MNLISNEKAGRPPPEGLMRPQSLPETLGSGLTLCQSLPETLGSSLTACQSLPKTLAAV